MTVTDARQPDAFDEEYVEDYHLTVRPYPEGLDPKKRGHWTASEQSRIKRNYVLGEIEHLLEARVRADKIAETLGYSSPDVVVEQMKRWGRRDLASRFARSHWDPLANAASRMGRKQW